MFEARYWLCDPSDSQY